MSNQVFGDELNGSRFEAIGLRGMSEFEAWLVEQACEHYPDSDFGKARRP